MSDTQNTLTSKADALEGLHAYIAQHGYAYLPVYDREGKIAGHYSVGFTRKLGQPEVLLLGLPGALASQFLHAIYIGMASGSITLPKTGELLEGLLNKPVMAKALTADQIDHLPIAQHQIFPDDDIHMVQLVVPDPQGYFPQDQHCQSDFVEHQDITRLIWTQSVPRRTAEGATLHPGGHTG